MQEPSDVSAGQREIAALRDEQARREQEFELLARRLAHDVQGVLQNIEGFASALRDRAADRLDQRDRHYLERIGANALKGNALVNDLLQYHRLASCPLETGTVDLQALLDRVARRVRQEHAPRDFQLDFAADAGPVQGDASLLEHALHALVANAVKFSAAADEPRIEVRCFRRGGLCEISVKDDGAGFDPAEAPRLFEPFVRLHATDRYAGNGLGLAIVRRIAERHGGTVRAEGAPERGATFTIALPAAGGRARAARPASQEGTEPLRLLLVDDDALVLTSLSGMLERAGHRVTSLPGGQQALAAFEQALDREAFDVVFTDWGMPQVGGERIAQAVKKIRPATKVVVLTGLPPEAVRGELDNVDVVLTKPVRLAQLRALFQDLGEQRAGRG